jgi:hypothetical protein
MSSRLLVLTGGVRAVALGRLQSRSSPVAWRADRLIVEIAPAECAAQLRIFAFDAGSVPLLRLGLAEGGDCNRRRRRHFSPFRCGTALRRQVRHPRLLCSARLRCRGVNSGRPVCRLQSGTRRLFGIGMLIR